MIGIILAAGYATRLFPLTKDMPKALLRVNKKPVIEYIADDMVASDAFDKIYLVTNNKFANHFKEWLGQKDYNKIEIINDGTENLDDRLGAIGDIIYLIDNMKINDNIFIIAADNLLENGIKGIIDCFSSKNRNSLIVKGNMEMEDLKEMGVANLDEDGKILSFEEKPQKPQTHNGVYAVYYFKKETIPYFHQFKKEGNNLDAPGYFPQWLMQYEDMYACEAKGRIFDIGTFDHLDEARIYFKGLGIGE